MSDEQSRDTGKQESVDAAPVADECLKRKRRERKGRGAPERSFKKFQQGMAAQCGFVRVVAECTPSRPRIRILVQAFAPPGWRTSDPFASIGP